MRFLKLSISVVFFAASRVADGCRKLLGLPGSPIFVVLYYHGISKAHRSRFAWQMEELRRLARPVSADFAGPLEAGTSYAAVTFDDGFQSVVDNALEELVARGIPSTHFVASAVLGQRPGWDMEPGVQDSATEMVMDAAELARLPADLVAVGSHSRTHPHMPELDASEAEAELVGSRRELEALLGRPVRLFTFPYGEYSDRLLAQCREAGYERAYSISPGLALSSPDEYLTGRTSVHPTDSRLEFRLKLLGAYRWLPLASALKKRMRSWL